MDGELMWPVGFLKPMLAEGKLEVFVNLTCTSQYRDFDNTNPVHTKGMPLSMRPKVWQLKILELVCSCLEPTDLICLVKFCLNLAKFLYSSGDAEMSPCNVTLAVLMDILLPLRDTLEELCLDMGISGVDQQLDDDDNSDPVQPLARFKSVKLLSTNAKMWHDYESDLDARNLELDLPDKQHLSRRLPPNLDACGPIVGR